MGGWTGLLLLRAGQRGSSPQKAQRSPRALPDMALCPGVGLFQGLRTQLGPWLQEIQPPVSEVSWGHAAPYQRISERDPVCHLTLSEGSHRGGLLGPIPPAGCDLWLTPGTCSLNVPWEKKHASNGLQPVTKPSTLSKSVRGLGTPYVTDRGTEARRGEVMCTGPHS